MPPTTGWIEEVKMRNTVINMNIRSVTRAVNIPRANNCKDFGPSHHIDHHHALSSRDSCQNHNGHSDYCSDIGIGGRHFNRCFSRRDSEETQEEGGSRYTNQTVIRWVPRAFLQITHAFCFRLRNNFIMDQYRFEI